MHKTIFTLTLLFFFSLSNAQTGSISGIVIDEMTGEILPFSTVVLKRETKIIKGAQSNMDGKFFIEDIPIGVYSLECSYVGYTTQKIDNILVEENAKLEIPIKMTSAGALVEEVKILGYKTPGISEPSITEIESRSIMDIESLSSSIRRGEFAGSSIPAKRSTVDLPESGQVTCGEWNDLHNWRDWIDLLKEDSYRSMSKIHDIYPIHRYPVLVMNGFDQVIPGIKVRLLDEDERVIWSTMTDNAGKAELWSNPYGTGTDTKPSAIEVFDGKKWSKHHDIVPVSDGDNIIRLGRECTSISDVDIAFVVDATSSMSDEIAYLKSELLDVVSRIKSINPDIDYRLGSVFYRDHGDAYVTRISPFDKDMKKTLDFIQKQDAAGGGDSPEAVDDALREVLDMNWRPHALKMAFLVLDAPPHNDAKTMERIKSQIKQAAEMGIRIIPVTASGLDRSTEFLMKYIAILTNGTYVFITDHSGIGNPHLAPVVEDFEVELLNDCLVRLIDQFSRPYSCDENSDNQKNDINLEAKVYPNPCTGYINIKSNKKPQVIKILSAGGMTVKTIVPQGKLTKVVLDDMVSGVYHVLLIFDNQKITKKFILVRN